VANALVAAARLLGARWVGGCLQHQIFGYSKDDGCATCRRPELLAVLQAGLGNDQQQHNSDSIVREAQKSTGSEQAFQEALKAWRQEEQETHDQSKQKQDGSSPPAPDQVRTP
jgi:hypothetical protein